LFKERNPKSFIYINNVRIKKLITQTLIQRNILNGLLIN